MPESGDQSLILETREPPMPFLARLRMLLFACGLTSFGLLGALAGWNALSAPIVAPDDRVLAMFLLCGGIAVAPAGAGFLWLSLRDERTRLRIDGLRRLVAISRSRRMLWSSRISQASEHMIAFADVCGIERHRAGRTLYLSLLTPDRAEPLGLLDRWPELEAAADQLVAIAREQDRLGNDSAMRTKLRRRSVKRHQLVGGLLVGALLGLICWALFWLLAGPAVP